MSQTSAYFRSATKAAMQQTSRVASGSHASCSHASGGAQNLSRPVNGRLRIARISGHSRSAYLLGTSRSVVLPVRAQADSFCKDKVSMPKASAATTGASYKLTFQGAGGQTRVIECPDDVYILDAADRNGLDLPATCRGGICGSCVARLASGSVDQSDVADLLFTLSEEEVEQGMALLCMSRPTSDCTIETQSDWGYSLGVSEWKGASGKFSASPNPLMGSSWSNDGQPCIKQ